MTPGCAIPRHARWPRHLLTAVVLVGLAMAGIAAADVEVTTRPAAESPVELLRPTAGEALEGGREAVVAWRARRDLAATGSEEWEAFLSLDGGRQWPIRITPHLDTDLTSFRFTVPRLPSDEVRLMLRFGDEHCETAYVLPQVLRLVVSDGETVPTRAAAPAFGRGEAAGPGVPGVVLWLDGGRRGQRLALRVASWQPPHLAAAAAGRLPQWLMLVPPRRHAPRCASVTPQPDLSRLQAPVPSPVRLAAALLPLLLLQCRRNE
jgi:hypothetical protein